MPTPISAKAFRDWTGGLNLTDDEVTLQPNESPNLLNVDVGVRGEIRKRKGYTKWSTSDPIGVGIGFHLFFWEEPEPSTDSWVIMVDDNSDVWYVNLTSSTTLVDAGFDSPTGGSHGAEATHSSGVSFKKYFWLTSRGGTPTVLRFDNAGVWTSVADLTPSGNGTEGTPEFVAAYNLIVAHDRLFASNVTYSATNFGSRLHFSTVAAPWNWPTLNFIDINPDDGQAITNMVLFNEQIIIFKEHSTYILAGKTENDFAIFPLSTQIGCSSFDGAIALKDHVYWFDRDFGFHRFNGATIEVISRPIDSWIKNTMDYTRAKRPSVFTFDDRIFFSITATGATTHNTMFVYDTRNGSWTKYDYGLNQAILTNAGYMLSAGNRNTSGVFKLFDGDTDNATTFTSTFETAWMPIGENLHGTRRIRHMDFLFSPQTVDSVVTVDFYTDFDGTTAKSTFTYDTETLTLEEVQSHQQGWRSSLLHGWVKFRFQNTTSQPWQLNGMEMAYSVRPSHKGGVGV